MFVVVVVREEEGAGSGLARLEVLPVEGRWGLKGLVFEAERSGGMAKDEDSRLLVVNLVLKARMGGCRALRLLKAC